MSTLVETERSIYEQMWTVEDYAKASPGEQLVPAFLEMSGADIETFPKLTVLDAGCGSGKGGVQLEKAGFRVTLCDLTPGGLIPEAAHLPFYAVCLWDDLQHGAVGYRWGRQFDYVYCCDVLEHLPTPFVMLAVQRMLAVSRRGVFLSVALQGDHFGVWVGKALHQTVMNFVQWRDGLNALAHVKECRDMLMSGLYFVEPRR